MKARAYWIALLGLAVVVALLSAPAQGAKWSEGKEDGPNSATVKLAKGDLVRLVVIPGRGLGTDLTRIDTCRVTRTGD